MSDQPQETKPVAKAEPPKPAATSPPKELPKFEKIDCRQTRAEIWIKDKN
jgi:hypothetical protein